MIVKMKPSQVRRSIDGWLRIKKATRKNDSIMSSRENKILTFVHPMLAKEADEPFDNKDWIFEVKWDGYRAISEVNKNTASLYSRNGNPFNLRYPSVIEELRKLNRRLILDGEIVVLDDYGKPDFQKLQFYEQNK